MNRWVRFATKFYPTTWRQRYETEFDALLEDSHSGWKDVADVFCGALMMQISMRSFRSIAATGGLSGLVLAAGIAFSLPNVYVSHAALHMNWNVIEENESETPLHPGDAWNDKLQQLSAEAFSRSSLASIIQRPDLNLYAKERASKLLEDVVERMRQKDIKLHVRATNRTSTSFTVAFLYPDPVVAQKTVDALVSKLADANQSLTTRSLTSTSRRAMVSLDLLDPASLPDSAVAPNRWQISFVGLGIGFAAGILTVVLRGKYRLEYQ
jgi:hypothetical protein